MEQEIPQDNGAEQESAPAGEAPCAHSTTQVEQEIRQDNATEQVPAPVSEEPCADCKSSADAPFATSCHNIFCEQCITDHIHSPGGSCPLCKIPIRSAPVPFSPNHDSFKVVEALSRTTADVQMEFSSSSVASIKAPGLNAARIIDALFNDNIGTLSSCEDCYLRIYNSVISDKCRDEVLSKLAFVGNNRVGDPKITIFT